MSNKIFKYNINLVPLRIGNQEHDAFRSDDIAEKFNYDNNHALLVMEALYNVCCVKEPDDVIAHFRLTDTVGIPVETILKVYKWIWGQEDCNYPPKEERWLSMNALLERFGIDGKDLI